MNISRRLLLVTAGLALTTAVSASDQPTLEMRLAKLGASLESARAAAHVPGMSIAIVKDDKIIWARGFASFEACDNICDILQRKISHSIAFFIVFRLVV